MSISRCNGWIDSLQAVSAGDAENRDGRLAMETPPICRHADTAPAALWLRRGRLAQDLIWNDPVKPARWSIQSIVHQRVLSSLLDVREHAASEVAEPAIATVDHSDIRGSEPHNRDPSGAASD